MGSPTRPDVRRKAEATLAELDAGRRDLEERAPRELVEMYAPRYAQLRGEIERLLDDETASPAEASTRLRRIRRRAAQLEATSIGTSIGMGPLGPLTRLFTVIAEKVRRRGGNPRPSPRDGD